LIDKTALITGASSGIGLEAAVKIAGMGAEVVLVARDSAKGDRALAEVARRSGSRRVSWLRCDLSSLDEVRTLADAFRARHQRLDVLVNNAGTVSPRRQTTGDGFEQTFAVNHLAHFLLTNLLIDLLVKSAPSRVVNVTSAAHRSGALDFANLQYERGGYSLLRAYSRSKLANVLFTQELALRLAARRVTVNAVHPGAVSTNIWSHTWPMVRPLVATWKLFMLSAEQGADTIVYLAESAGAEGQSGGYYEKNRRVDPSRSAQDRALARRLWEESARLAGIPPV